ncbi:sigma-70 family RNA polymerase sigma factor [Stappia sp. F7233]|uniref:Sigma-70 family RNA polymerase sigma factor n=1 Tax=Stappia albiluteola TaxID=2758565 RepID=A0A839AEI3_9HYPH|nr:sigma-70 family RNA polymerase sigma factor [Stappia albiluteola]MBA5777536.1 sigma-70 family RNA polymerase sigma factor [Stappia albiluteola]
MTYHTDLPTRMEAELQAEIVHLIPSVRSFSRSFHLQSYDSDDLVQETLTKAVAKLDQFSPGTNMKAWLFTIMRNTYCSNSRTAKRELPDADDCASHRPSVDAPQDWVLLGKQVAAAVNRLPAQQRKALILVGALGVSYKRAAALCDCPKGTIKSRLSRARENLLKELEEDERGSGPLAGAVPKGDTVPARTPSFRRRHR